MATMKQNIDELNSFIELVEPISVIMGDDDIASAYKENKSIFKTLTLAAEKHPEEIIKVCAAYENVPIDEYEFSRFRIIKILMKMTNDPEFAEVFQ